MFRSVAARLVGTVRNATVPVSRLAAARQMSSKAAESDDQFDAR